MGSHDCWSAKKTRPARPKTAFLPILGLRGELFRAHAHTAGPSSATNIARRTQKHGDIETNNTTAHPQQGTCETRITSAPENCTNNAHFSPAKAMAVSIPHRHQRAKAIGVSDKRPTWPTGPVGGACGRRQGHGGIQAPPTRRERRARLRCPWAVAGPGRASSRRAEPIISTPGSTGVEGAGGTGGHGRASRRGAERSEAA